VFRTIQFSGVSSSASGNLTVEGDARIMPLNADSPHFGRLEVFHNNEWGTVCSDGFSHTAARVACRQIGFAGGDVAPLECSSQLNVQGKNLCGLSKQRVWLDDVTCIGNEDQITECPRLPWAGSDKCAHSRDILVQCTTTTSTSDLLELSEGFDAGFEVGTGNWMSTRAATNSTDIQATASRGMGRAVPIPAADKPVHEEYAIQCSPVRKQKAETVVCYPAIAQPTLFQRCVADYCLTGSEVLAAVNVNMMEKETQQASLVTEEATLLNKEEAREEKAQASAQADVDKALEKENEQDRVVQEVLHMRATSSDQPCPP
jgi:hypothetical protein